MKQLLIVGARGYGRTVYNIALRCIENGADFEVKGFLDDKNDALDVYNNYPPILDSVENYQVQQDDVFICALSDTKFKQVYVNIILSKGGSFINVISPSAKIMCNTEFGVGCVVGDNTVIGCDVKIGNFVTVLGMASIGHDVKIDDWCHIGAFCFLGGYAKMIEGSTIQTGSKILPNKIIGSNATVGAGSIVIKNVKNGTTVVGNPARLLF